MSDGIRLIEGDDGVSRCSWCVSTPQYVAYHDEEWGLPVSSDVRLFEKLVLEAFQSGLSWRTILAKRDGFRSAFAGFEPERVARFDARDVDRLLGDAAIVRHRGKIEAAIHNAQRACELIAAHGSLAAFVWRYEPPRSARPRRVTPRALAKLASTPHSKALARDLKQAGWVFVGPTTAYAFMQAMGMVNDHLEGCAARERVEQARATFVRPR